MQGCSNSIALAMELLQSCAKLSISVSKKKPKTILNSQHTTYRFLTLETFRVNVR